MQQHSLQPDVVGHQHGTGPSPASFHLGKVLVILAAIPLSIAKNGLRMLAISMLTAYVDPGYMHGRLRHQGGIVFFLVFLAVCLILLRLVGWIEHNPAHLTVSNT